MSVTRRTVLEQLAAESDAGRGETTTIDALAAALAADEEHVEARLDSLTACELARTRPDGRVRVTVTGEEFLELDPDQGVIIDAPTRPRSNESLDI